MATFIKNNSYTILLIIITMLLTYILTTYNTNTITEPRQIGAQPETSSHTVKEFYVITKVSNNEYYGKSLTSDEGIFFTNEYITDDNSITEGDKVKAEFANQFEDDSLIKITKLD